MKTKLLKKVRKKYRIVKNGLGHKFLQEKHLILGWDQPTLYINTSNKTEMDMLKYILHEKYGKYTRKYKVNKEKKQTIKVIWYKNN